VHAWSLVRGLLLRLAAAIQSPRRAGLTAGHLRLALPTKAYQDLARARGGSAWGMLGGRCREHGLQRAREGSPPRAVDPISMMGHRLFNSAVHHFTQVRSATTKTNRAPSSHGAHPFALLAARFLHRPKVTQAMRHAACAGGALTASMDRKHGPLGRKHNRKRKRQRERQHGDTDFTAGRNRCNRCNPPLSATRALPHRGCI
jgi:hypothetical protein